jgi:hypothetical protein
MLNTHMEKKTFICYYFVKLISDGIKIIIMKILKKTLYHLYVHYERNKCWINFPVAVSYMIESIFVEEVRTFFQLKN